jgi:hypothetical protein
MPVNKLDWTPVQLCICVRVNTITFCSSAWLQLCRNFAASCSKAQHVYLRTRLSARRSLGAQRRLHQVDVPCEVPDPSHRYHPNTPVIYTHRYIWTLYCCQTNDGPARWHPMLTLPSKDSGSSQRVATASRVGVRSLAQLSCGTLYRRQPRSGRARKPSSY